jgi:hypothetical protein
MQKRQAVAALVRPALAIAAAPSVRAGETSGHLDSASPRAPGARGHPL